MSTPAITMRRIAIINQKGGVGKTTTTANLGAALASLGRRVALVDLDPQANLTLHLGAELAPGEPSVYDLLLGRKEFGAALRTTSTAGLALLPSHIDLSGAELELASAFGRETLLRDAIDTWESQAIANTGQPPADYVLVDCPPSLALLSVNGLAAVHEAIVTLQTEFFALQGISKLVEVIQLMRRRINPALTVAGILPTLYDSRLRLAREVLAEIRRYFRGQVFEKPIRTNIKLAEAPSHGCTIFEYDPTSSGAHDYMVLAREIIAAEGQEPEQAGATLTTPQVEQLDVALSELERPSRPARAPASAPFPEATPEPAAEVASEPAPEPAPGLAEDLPCVELAPAPPRAATADSGPGPDDSPSSLQPQAPPESAPEPAVQPSQEQAPLDPASGGPAEALASRNQSDVVTATLHPITAPVAPKVAPDTKANPAPAEPLEQSEVEPEQTAAPVKRAKYNFMPTTGEDRPCMPARSPLGNHANGASSDPRRD